MVVIQAGLGRPLSSVPLFLFTAKELNMKGMFPLSPTRENEYGVGRELTETGTVRYTPGCFEDAVDLLERKAVDLGPLITSTYPLTKCNEAFEAQALRKDIKIVIMNQE